MTARSVSPRPLISQIHSGRGSRPKGPGTSVGTIMPESRPGCPWWDRERLVELLVQRSLTYEAAAAEMGCHPKTVRKWAQRYGIGREVTA